LCFVVGEVGLRLHALVLDGNFIVELCCHLFCWQRAKVLLLAVNHEQNLPRVSVLGDPTVLRAPEVANEGTFEDFLVTQDYGFLITLVAEDFNKTTALFQY